MELRPCYVDSAVEWTGRSIVYCDPFLVVEDAAVLAGGSTVPVGDCPYAATSRSGREPLVYRACPVEPVGGSVQVYAACAVVGRESYACVVVFIVSLAVYECRVSCAYWWGRVDAA